MSPNKDGGGGLWVGGFQTHFEDVVFWYVLPSPEFPHHFGTLCKNSPKSAKNCARQTLEFENTSEKKQQKKKNVNNKQEPEGPLTEDPSTQKSHHDNGRGLTAAATIKVKHFRRGAHSNGGDTCYFGDNN